MSTVQEIEAAIRGLSPSELAQLRRAIAELDRQSSERRLAETSTEASAPQAKPYELRPLEERAAAFRQWVDSHAPITAVADDSRESIY